METDHTANSQPPQVLVTMTKMAKLLLFITTPRWLKFAFEFSGGKIEMTRPRKRLVFVKGAKNHYFELLIAPLNL